MLTRIAEAPWETICVDFVGPLTRTKHGNATLIVIVNKFSTAEAFLKVFRERIIARVEAPRTLISDNGVQFTGKKTKPAMEQWGERQQFTRVVDNISK